MSKKKTTIKNYCFISCRLYYRKCNTDCIKCSELSNILLWKQNIRLRKQKEAEKNAQFSDYDIDIMVVTNPDYR